MRTLCYGQTDIGMKRKSNQDSIFFVPGESLSIVADGMGGHNGGDIASQMSVALLPEFIKSNKELPPKDLLKAAVTHVNQMIFKKAEENPELKGMGTTLNICYFHQDSLFLANVGDSRCYLSHQHFLFQLSRDHSLVQEKINLGLYNREEAKNDKNKNVLVRAVGFEPQLDIDIFEYKLSPFELILNCSDGLHGKVSDADIHFIIEKHLHSPQHASEKVLQELVNELIGQANQNGGQDNISVIANLLIS